MTEQNDVLARAGICGDETAGPVTAATVNQPMIRRWAERMGTRTRCGTIRPPAPPLASTDRLRGFGDARGVDHGAPIGPVAAPEEDGMAVLEPARCRRLYRHCRHQYRAGISALSGGRRRHRSRAIISDVSDEKRTGLGIDHFRDDGL